MSRTSLPALTRRDFEFVAWTLRRYAEDRNAGRMPCGLAEAFADALAGTNGRFNRERFLRACEVKSCAR